MDVLERALFAATSFSLAAVGDIIVELLGLSIGGAASSAAVSARFAAEEHAFLSDSARQKEWGSIHISSKARSSG